MSRRALRSVGAERLLEDDKSLLEACRRGDRRAWSRLIERYERLVFAIPRSMGLSEEDSADVAQATLLALLQQLDQLDEPDRLRAWLVTVARRQSFRAVERLQRDRALATSSASEAATTAYPDGGSMEIRLANLAWVHQALAQLPERCQRLLLALYDDDEAPSYAQIAQRLGMPQGSLGPTRSRCLDALRKVLASLDEPAG